MPVFSHIIGITFENFNHIMDGENPPPAELWAVDLNYSGYLNILDIVRLLNFILMH